MPCLWLQHNNSQLFINVGILDASDVNITASGTIATNIPMPPPMFIALVDTGAQKTMISTRVVRTLGLQPQGMIPIQGVGPNVTHHNGYLFHVAFTIPLIAPGQQIVPGSPIPVMMFIHPTAIYGAELTSTTGFDVLLGMDILSSGSLKVEGSGHFSFSF
jgi:Aspartyl protease